MAKDPAFLFYPGDWLGGTLGMTFEEKGAYVELLMLQFNRGHMTTRMIEQTVGQLWDNIKFKFDKDDDGLWFNERLEIEKDKRSNYVESRYNNKSGKNQHSKSSSKNKGHMTSHMEDENEDENISEDAVEVEIVSPYAFDDFWDAYDRKVGKPKCIKKWGKLNDDIRAIIMMHVPMYIASTPDKQYRKHPSTYLSNECWEDEILQRNGKQSTEEWLAEAEQHLQSVGI